MGAILTTSQEEGIHLKIKIKDALALIPEYSSKSVTEYVYFREGCLEALDLLGVKHEKSLLKFIKLKLKGMAHSQYALSVAKFNNLPDFLDYVQKRDFRELNVVDNWKEEIWKVKKKHNESVYDYGVRMEAVLQCALTALKLRDAKNEIRQLIEFLSTFCFRMNTSIFMFKEGMRNCNSVLRKCENIVNAVLCTERWLQVKIYSTKCEICFSIYHTVDKCYYGQHDVNVNASKGDCKIRSDSMDSPKSHTEGHELKSSSDNADNTHQSEHSSKGDSQNELQKQQPIGILLPSINSYLDREAQLRLEMRHRNETNKFLKDFGKCEKPDDERCIARAKLLNKQSEEMLKLVNCARKIFMQDEGLESSDIYPETAPLPKPPVFCKADLYKDPRVFAYVDKIAYQNVDRDQESFTDLVRHLVSKCKSDVEVVRAIFQWITRFKIVNFSVVKCPITKDEHHFKTWEDLFQLLCSYAGLHCKVIEGYDKDDLGLDKEPNVNLKTYHWNSVFVANSWRSVNFHNFYIYGIDDHFFLTDPQEAIYRIFPLQKEWQLLEQPISFEDFAKLPKVEPNFFKYGLLFKNTNAVMYTGAFGTTTVRLEIPADVKSFPFFEYNLLSSGLASFYNHVHLGRFVMQSVVDNEVTFSVHAPCPDTFMLQVYAKEGNYQICCKICTIYIVCKKVLMEPIPLPICRDPEWGPNKATRLFGLVPISHKEAELVTDGEFKIQFRMTRPLDGFQATLCKNNFKKEQRHEVTGDVVTFSIDFPTKGQYGLDISTRVPSKKVFEHCCQYLIRYCIDKITLYTYENVKLT